MEQCSLLFSLSLFPLFFIFLAFPYSFLYVLFHLIVLLFFRLFLLGYRGSWKLRYYPSVNRRKNTLLFSLDELESYWLDTFFEDC